MDSTTLLNRPKITPKITKINSLALVSTQARKSSTKLVKVFEKGTYHKRTQLTVLNRYKRKLDSIQKQNDRKLTKKTQVKLKLPDIKKYVGNFFTPGSTNDPLKAIGTLAAFKAFQKGSKGDWGGAIGSGLVAAGLLGGGALALKGVKGMFGGRNVPTTSVGTTRAVIPPTGNRTVFGGITSRLGRVGSPTGTLGIRSNIGLTARQFQAGAFMQTPGARAAFPVALPGTPSTAERLGGASQNIANRLATRGGGAAASAATSRAGGTIAAKSAGVGARAIPLLGTAFNIGLSAYRFSQGDVVGGILSAVSAIPILGWAALGVDLAREFGAFDGTILGRKDALKSQTEQQKELVKQKKEEGGKLTFKKTLNSYDKAVTKFEQFSNSFVPSTRAKSTYVEGREPAPPPPPPGQNIVADTQVVQDAIDFRNQFPLGRGTPNVSMTPHELHLRENTMLHAAGIGNDPTVESVHVQGSAHYSNRAIDIPVNSKPLGDRVAQFWRSRGYYVIWQAPGHYDHVHVQWNAGSTQSGPPAQGAGGTKGYIIVPGHASGGGAPGEKALVKRLAIDAYNKIKRQNPNAPVQYMDLDSMFEDTDLGPTYPSNRRYPGFNKQKKWYEDMERQGYQVLEIHMDQKGGIGKGVIRSHGQQSAVSNEWIRQGNYAYPKDWRSKPGEQPLAGPHRGVDLFELGSMKSGAYSQRDIDSLTAPFVSSVLSSIRGSVRQTSVPLNTRLPYQQGYRAPQPTVIPYPVIQQTRQPQMMQASSSAPELMGGPSEEQLLNSFYKKVLLNTLM